MICFLSHDKWMRFRMVFHNPPGVTLFMSSYWKECRRITCLTCDQIFLDSSPVLPWKLSLPSWFALLAVDVLSRFKYAVPGRKKEIVIFFFTKVALPNYSFISRSSNDWLVVRTLTNKDTDRHCLIGMSSEMVRLQFGGCLCACFRKDGCLHHHHWPPFLI